MVPPKDVILKCTDFGIGSSDLVIERAQGKKIVLLASIFQYSPYIFISRKNVGIDNIFKVLRVDYVRRFTYLDHPNIAKWGIRVRFRFTF